MYDGVDPAATIEASSASVSQEAPKPVEPRISERDRIVYDRPCCRVVDVAESDLAGRLLEGVALTQMALRDALDVLGKRADSTHGLQRHPHVRHTIIEFTGALTSAHHPCDYPTRSAQSIEDRAQREVVGRNRQRTCSTQDSRMRRGPQRVNQQHLYVSIRPAETRQFPKRTALSTTKDSP